MRVFLFIALQAARLCGEQAAKYLLHLLRVYQ
jgi:hypothetical protein